LSETSFETCFERRIKIREAEIQLLSVNVTAMPRLGVLFVCSILLAELVSEWMNE